MRRKYRDPDAPKPHPELKLSAPIPETYDTLIWREYPSAASSEVGRSGESRVDAGWRSPTQHIVAFLVDSKPLYSFWSSPYEVSGGFQPERVIVVHRDGTRTEYELGSELGHRHEVLS